MKDANAAQKPVSAYFLFLQRVRSDPETVKEVFGNETDMTKQSILAAAKWHSMTDDERKVRVNPLRTDPTGNPPLVYSRSFGSRF